MSEILGYVDDTCPAGPGAACRATVTVTADYDPEVFSGWAVIQGPWLHARRDGARQQWRTWPHRQVQQVRWANP